MQKLFHLSTTAKGLGLFNEDWHAIRTFIHKNGMDGIELGLTLDYDLMRIPKELIQGVHLSFYPMWLDFWKGDQDKLKQLFKNQSAWESYYHAKTPKELVQNYTLQYKRAKALDAKYMVFHVSHVLPEDTFTFQYSGYTDKDVMEATIELVNRAFKAESDGPLLLFENLWWPGLTYKDPELTEWFIEQIHYPNKGFVVDISHLILTCPTIGTEKEAYYFIEKTINALGDTKNWIKVVHMNKTLPKHYMNRDHSYLLKQYQLAEDEAKKTAILKKHIKTLDGHIPFDHPMAGQILKLMNPLYCVYETAPKDRYELAYFIKKQHEAIQ